MKDNNLNGDLMYQSFSKYKQIRENNEFNEKAIVLCEGIANLQVGLDEWWENKGLPIVLEKNYSDKDELLVEFLNGVGQAIGQAGRAAWQGAKNFGNGVAQGWQASNGMNPNAAPNAMANNHMPDQSSPARGPADMNGVLQAHQMLMTKLKDLQSGSVQQKDQQTYQVVSDLMKQMNNLPNAIRNIQQPQQPQQSPGQMNRNAVAAMDPAKVAVYQNR